MRRTTNVKKVPHYLQGVRVAREGRNPSVHGEIKGCPVGTTWKSRYECSVAGVHAPLTAGIHGNARDGAYSVVLSGGYEDDIDFGEIITYTGQGGRATKGTRIDQLEGKRAWGGPQIAHQEWTFGNKALKISCETKEPIRVVRGSQPDSLYAPLQGYRYDGLYVVEEAWRAVGLTEYKTCRFKFRRLPNQPPIQKRPSTSGIDELRDPLTHGISPEAGPSGPSAPTPPSPKSPYTTIKKTKTKPRARLAAGGPRPRGKVPIPLLEETPSPTLSTPLTLPTIPYTIMVKPQPEASVVQKPVRKPSWHANTDDEDDEDCVSNHDTVKRPWASVEGVRKYEALKFKKWKTSEDAGDSSMKFAEA